jgi:hypothetical protein
MMMISCWNNVGKVILVINLKFSSRAPLAVCQSLLCLRKSTVEISLKSPKGYMLRASREETLSRTNKSIKTVELSQHNCDVRVHSLPSHEADHCGSWKQTFACGVWIRHWSPLLRFRFEGNRMLTESLSHNWEGLVEHGKLSCGYIKLVTVFIVPYLRILLQISA